MEALAKLIGQFFANQKDILDIIAYAVALASIIVKITPSLKDDNYLKPLIRFIGRYIALDKFGPNSGKETPK